MVGGHAQRFVHECMQGGFGAVVPGAVDVRHGRDVPVDVAFRPGGLARACSRSHAMRGGLRDSRFLKSALRRAVSAEWNGSEVHAPALNRRGRQGRWDSFSSDANHKPRFGSRPMVDGERLIRRAISRTPNPSRLRRSSIRFRSLADRRE